MSEKDVEESVVASGHSPPIVVDPSAHIFSHAITDPNGTPEDREKLALDEDSYFTVSNSIIVVDGLSELQAVLDTYVSEVKKYNDKLLRNKSGFVIRSLHKTSIRKKIYVYTGSYIYRRTKEPLTVVDPVFTDTSLPKKKETGKAVKKGTAKGAKAKAKAKAEDKAKQVSFRLEYVMRYDPTDWRRLVDKEVLSEVGMPPRPPFPNIRFQRVVTKKKESNTIIIPYLVFITGSLKAVFDGCATFRIP